MVRRVEISRQTNRFDGFFKVDEYSVSYETHTGQMSGVQQRLVFERGDSVAVLLLNLDSENVVLVRQFKLPTVVGRRRTDKTTTDGWITETIAGMIDENETPEAAVIRETLEETGYQISNPRLIATFFSSPGGSSERIFLYFSEVHDSNKTAAGGGVNDEDIEIVHVPVDELFDWLKTGAIDDPKLIIASSWLEQHRKSGVPLSLGTVSYALEKNRNLIVGYKTGDIENIKGVSVWVNSENQDMLMDRFIGKTISANIRRLGSNRNRDGTVIEDTIHDSLRTAVGRRHRVEIGTVLETVPGALWVDNGVNRILHVAAVRARGDGRGVRAERSDLENCVKEVLKRAQQINRRLWNRFLDRADTSILFPLVGAGDGGLPVERVAETIIPPAVTYLQNNPDSILKEIYFLAYTTRDKAACDRVLERLEDSGVLVAVGR